MKNSTIVFCILFSSLIFSQENYIASNAKTENYVPAKTKEVANYSYSFVDTGVNTELSEIGTAFFKDKFIIISNKKRRHTPTFLNESTNTFNNNLYCTDVDKNGNLSFPLHFSLVLNSDFNEGAMTFNADESRVYFVQTTSATSKNFQLFAAEFDDEVNGKWKNKKVISISNENFSIETPYVDKLTNLLYFSSNMPNGFGGFDLYKATISESGELDNVENLGAAINSPNDEKYAYTTPDGKYLYFSSNKQESIGGYDVFRASNTPTLYTNVVNMGSGLNSVNDEIGFMMINKTQGYLSKNKSDDAQDFDILRFDMVQSNQQLNLDIVELNSKAKLANAAIVISDEFGKEIFNGQTNASGSVSLDIDPLTKYTVVANKEGYEEEKQELAINSNTTSVSKVIRLTKKSAVIAEEMLVVENILFEFNKVSISNESLLSLNKVIDELKGNATLSLLVNAHTDNKGSEKYNQILSEKRAKFAYDFLVKKGIAPSRITYTGYGESQPLFKCDSCTPEQDQLNRRVEFKIVKQDVVEDVIINKN